MYFTFISHNNSIFFPHGATAPSGPGPSHCQGATAPSGPGSSHCQGATAPSGPGPSHCQGATAPSGPGPSHCQGFKISFRHTTPGKTPLDELSARSKDLYLTTHNNQRRQISMTPAGFEPAIPAGDRPQTHALGREVTGIGNSSSCYEI